MIKKTSIQCVQRKTIKSPYTSVMYFYSYRNEIIIADSEKFEYSSNCHRLVARLNIFVIQTFISICIAWTNISRQKYNACVFRQFGISASWSEAPILLWISIVASNNQNIANMIYLFLSLSLLSRSFSLVASLADSFSHSIYIPLSLFLLYFLLFLSL